MALKNSERFIKEIVKNDDLRQSLYQYDSKAEIMAAISEMGYSFKPFEFEESINHLKVESPHEAQAMMLGELLVWWNMLMASAA